MTGASATAAGIVCPGFGVVGDEPADKYVLGCPVQGTLGRITDLTVELGGDPAYVKAARDHTAMVLATWDLKCHIPGAALVVSELMTNAIRHATPPGIAVARPVLLRLVRRGRKVMCLVGDCSDRPPTLIEADHVAETGRGLHLVAAHSDRWSWARRRYKPGKWVWALLSPPSSASR